MQTLKKLALMGLTLLALTGPAYAAPAIGQPAPDFTGTDSNGNAVKLSDFKGKTVVLEWTNPQCPFVIKHYDSKNMQKLQGEATGKGVVWLSINSSAEGMEGYNTPEESNKVIADQGAKATARLIDASGEIGRLYEAKTTPHMFVIDQQGILVYAGAIDSDPSPRQDGIPTATNYVTAALEAVASGKPVEPSATQPYGCSVKYKPE